MQITATFDAGFMRTLLNISLEYVRFAIEENEEYTYDTLSTLHHVLRIYTSYLKAVPCIPLDCMGEVYALLQMVERLDEVTPIQDTYSGLLHLINQASLELELEYSGNQIDTIVSFVTTLYARPQNEVDTFVDVWNSRVMFAANHLQKNKDGEELARQIYTMHYEGTLSDYLLNSIILEFLTQIKSA